ncbi:hypothetical protein SEVIR_1G058000v4 [Setaria viridis]|uniref:Uncharacterized protein n=2 Tax=Setaria TaxID=4554 RepID=K3YW09_SETIT|nr:uncharacterized protein LOC101774897 [Setaria italica]XP_034577394.1 uncharacterized protein LOC117840954 [Setaria viridis]RCV05138.1 hypothetical protein SETIT_1G058600v2 [Setaria italica]TKW37589.1 hypothetical protein SEVIR_1G058000v2 [Setaria viridis]
MDSGSDSDSAPEELTAVQGVEKHEKISKVEKDSAIRVTREGKERRKRWAQRRTSSKPDNPAPEEIEDQGTNQREENEETHTMPGMLPSSVIEMLAAREKQTFSSDSEEENVKQKVQKKKKRTETSGPETILLKDVRSTQHVKNALDFLEQRKNQVPRSNAVLKNANKALRLLSSKGNFLS